MRRLAFRRGGVIASAVAAPWVLWAVLRTLGLEYGHPLVALVRSRPTRRGWRPYRSSWPCFCGAGAVAGVAALALLTALLPARSVRADRRWSGLGLLARAPLRAAPLRSGSSRAQLEAVLSTGDGTSLRVVAVHPLPPVSRANTRAWRVALRNLPAARANGAPRVLLGDFNAKLDHHELHRLLSRGYVDAADATGDGLRPTWPTTGRRPPLTSRRVRPSRISRASASDRASRSSFVTTSVSPLRTRCARLTLTWTLAVRPGQPVIDVGALAAHAESRQRVALPVRS